MSDVQRGNLYSYDPNDIGIVGGLALPNDDERGPLDTAIDEAHPLYDRSMFDLDRIVDEPFVANIDTYGVKSPIRVKKIKGVPFVVFGRRRLRGARRANLRRIARGEPTLRIDVVLETSSDELHLMGAMDGENWNRADVGFGSQMAAVHRYIDRGVGVASIATIFGMPEAQLKSYLRFEDEAVVELRFAVEQGAMSISAGLELMRAGDADAQRAALFAVSEETSETGEPGEKTPAKVSTRAARNAAKTVARPNAQLGVGDRKTQTRLLQALRDKSHNLKATRTVDFFTGAENMLTLIMGGDEAKETDPRLVELLKEVRKAMKSAKTIRGGK